MVSALVQPYKGVCKGQGRLFNPRVWAVLRAWLPATPALLWCST